MKMREIVEKELKMKHHLLESPSHQKVNTSCCCFTGSFGVRVVFVTYFTVHCINWRFNQSGIITCCSSLSKPFHSCLQLRSHPKNGIIRCHITLPLTCLLLFPFASLCLPNPLTPLFLASRILVSLQMVLETCTCKCDPVELLCSLFESCVNVFSAEDTKIKKQ